MPTTVIWKNGISGTWQTMSDWTPSVVPGSADSVLITSAGTYTVTDALTTTIYSLATEANATLDITGGTFTITDGTGSGTNAGTIEVGTGATLDILPSTVANTGTLANAGSLYLNNTTISGGSLTNAGTVDVTGGGTSTFDGVGVTNSGGTGTVTGPLALDGNGFSSRPFESTTSTSVTLTTANANDVIILDIVQNGTTVSSVSDTADLVWHQRAVAGSGSRHDL